MFVSFVLENLYIFCWEAKFELPIKKSTNRGTHYEKIQNHSIYRRSFSPCAKAFHVEVEHLLIQGISTVRYRTTFIFTESMTLFCFYSRDYINPNYSEVSLSPEKEHPDLARSSIDI